VVISATAAHDTDLSCPPWCQVSGIDQHEQRAGSLSEHRQPVGEFWQRELRTPGGRIVRPARGRVSVGLLLLERSDGALGEEIVTVDVTGDGLELTNGEARHLAALLVAATDRLDGLRP
jgi:hypothetical protein